jgi:hypothetical protein
MISIVVGDSDSLLSRSHGFRQLDNIRQFVFKDVFLKLVLAKLDYEPYDLHPIIDIP